MKTVKFSTLVALILPLIKANAVPLNVTHLEARQHNDTGSSMAAHPTMHPSTVQDIPNPITTITSTPTAISTRTFKAVADGARLPPMTPVEQHPHPPMTIAIRDSMPPMVGQTFSRSAPPTCVWIENVVFVSFVIDGLRDWHLNEEGIKKRLNRCGAVTGFGVDPEIPEWYAAVGLLDDDGHTVDKENLRYRASWNQPVLTDKGMQCVEKVIAEEIGNDVKLPCVLVLDD